MKQEQISDQEDTDAARHKVLRNMISENLTDHKLIMPLSLHGSGRSGRLDVGLPDGYFFQRKGLLGAIK